VTEPRVQDCKRNSQVFHQTPKNELQDAGEEPATSQAKEETTSSLRARNEGALTTLGSFAHTDWKRRNGCSPVGCEAQADLRREECVMSIESWKFNQKRCPLLGYSIIKS
jgi:hypothetical protein